jgi:hypothetical protein
LIERKGRDRIPAVGREVLSEGESRKNYLIFCLEEKILNLNFDVPKANKKRRSSSAKASEG